LAAEFGNPPQIFFERLPILPVAVLPDRLKNGTGKILAQMKSLPKNDHHARERRRIFPVSELQSPAQNPDLGVWILVYVVVKVRRVCAGRNEHHHGCIGLLGLFGTFFHPVLNTPAVRRVAKDCLPLPRLLQSVVRYSEVAVAFVIGRISTRIEGKVKL